MKRGKSDHESVAEANTFTHLPVILTLRSLATLVGDSWKDQFPSLRRSRMEATSNQGSDLHKLGLSYMVLSH